jgi:uncharacterized protein (TIGR03435 family)
VYRTITAVTLASLVLTTLGGQTVSGLPQFEVASIKPSDPANPQKSSNLRGDRLVATNYSLRNLIQIGWNVRSFEVLGGPAWLDSEKYNVDAKPAVPLDMFGPPAEGIDKVRLMVQSLLADRFKLRLHTETREMSVYFLVVGRNGVKLKRTADAVGPGTSMHDAGRGRFVATQIDMRMLAQNELGGEVGVPVIDKTNLSGAYDLTLEWNPDDEASGPPPGASPSIFTAIQEQLGLKLEAGKGPVEILHVDHAERASDN